MIEVYACRILMVVRIAKVIGTWSNYNNRPIFPLEVLGSLSSITGATNPNPPSPPRSRHVAQSAPSKDELGQAILAKIPSGVPLSPLLAYMSSHSPDPQHILAILSSLFPIPTTLPASLDKILRALPYNAATVENHIPDPAVLYDTMPLVCKQCGRRWREGEEAELASHLDFHFRVNRRTRESVVHVARDWYFCGDEWVAGGADVVVVEEGEGAVEEVQGEDLLAEGGEGRCRVCGEEFERFWSEEEEDWYVRNVIKAGGEVVHYGCWVDSGGFAGLKAKVKVEVVKDEVNEEVVDEMKEEVVGGKRKKMEDE
jgi:hypothetical protein